MQAQLIPSNESPERKPNESGGIIFSSFIKITDPKTGSVLVEQRGD